MTEGIDVSVYQSSTPPLTGLGFLFARATYGSSPDSSYPMHIANARKAGIVVGAYHFGVSFQSVPVQVAAFLKVAGSADLFVLDLEAEHGIAPMTNDQAREFIAAVKATGRRCGLYHSEAGFPSLGQDYNWVANWSQVPAVPWAFWQWQGSPLDRDRFNGSLADLKALAYPKEPTVQTTFIIKPDAKVGSLVVTGGGHYYIRLADGVLSPAPEGWAKPYAIGPVTLKPPIPGGAAGADRSTAYLVGDEAAAFLASDVTFTPAPPVDTAPAVNAALDHVLAAVTDVGKAIQEARPR